MIDEIKEMLKKSEEIGYNRALVDLMRELRLQNEDGLILSDMMLTRTIEKIIKEYEKDK